MILGMDLGTFLPYLLFWFPAIFIPVLISKRLVDRLIFRDG